MAPEDLPKKTGIPILFLAGAIGAIFAAISDIVQKDKASAIVTISQKVAEVFISGFSPIHALFLVLLLGAGLCFVFEPETKPKAFYLGASVLAIAMTLVPFRKLPELSQPTEVGETRPGLQLLPTAHAFAQQRVSGQQGAEVQIHLTTEGDSKIGESTITLSDLSSRKVLAQSTITESVFKFFRSPGRYLVRVESDGFQIVEDEIEVKPGKTDIEIQLKPATLPLYVQRIFPARPGQIDVWHSNLEIQSNLPISANNTARQTEPNLWGWTVFIEGPDDALDQIECVEYTLHPTFARPVQKVCDRGTGQHAFSLSASGWGTFEIAIRVFLKDGRVQEMKHYLEF